MASEALETVSELNAMFKQRDRRWVELYRADAEVHIPPGLAGAPNRGHRAPRGRAVSLTPLDGSGPGPALIAVGLLVALCAVGCGATREKRGQTRARFIASAEAVCRHEQAKLAYIQTRAQRLGRASNFPAVIRQRVVQSQMATARLEALPEPPGEARAITRWLTARTVAATVAFDLSEAPTTGNAKAVAGVRTELGRVQARARSLALAYGSQVCGETD